VHSSQATWKTDTLRKGILFEVFVKIFAKWPIFMKEGQILDCKFFAGSNCIFCMHPQHPVELDTQWGLTKPWWTELSGMHNYYKALSCNDSHPQG
jgi:hypothetical protein